MASAAITPRPWWASNCPNSVIDVNIVGRMKTFFWLPACASPLEALLAPKSLLLLLSLQTPRRCPTAPESLSSSATSSFKQQQNHKRLSLAAWPLRPALLPRLSFTSPQFNSYGHPYPWKGNKRPNKGSRGSATCGVDTIGDRYN